MEENPNKSMTSKPPRLAQKRGDVKMVSWLETQDLEARAESVRTADWVLGRCAIKAGLL